MSSQPKTVITISGQRPPNREAASASEIFPTIDPQALEVPPDTPKLEYSRLPNSTSFRLLQILSDSGQDILRCKMFDADLAAQDTPRYIALSYTWHEESLPNIFRPVLINEKYLKVSLNLWNFLQNYRETAGERIIWIDQICINQDDKDECVQQMGQMCAIYERASMDLFWIGEPDQHTEDVMHMLESLNRLEMSHLASGDQRPGIDALRNPIYTHDELPRAASERRTPELGSLTGIDPAFQGYDASRQDICPDELGRESEFYAFAALAPTRLSKVGGRGLSGCHSSSHQPRLP
ncbi:hypothetical protein CEP54_014737 [Fusarium duplospermum]|uniref:Heterokaryon incompatibility domain-containing protein n=1 Tax=Fusarium duplospermum TaxID=1325734 RepID=A0A428NU89_9HYPO|nr:hypothetical protein CEP54_014737 [Fusarium duplospermum]